MRWQEHVFCNGMQVSQAGCIWMPYSTLTTRCRSIRYELDLLLPAEWRFHLFYMRSNYILKFMVGGLEEKRPWLFSACVRKIMNNFFIFSQTQDENSDVIKLLPPSFWDAVSAWPHWPCLSHSLLHIAISTICPDQVISCRPPAATYATTCFCNIQKCQKIANKSSDVCGSGSIK